MIAPNTTTRPETFTLKVKRQDTPDTEPYWQTFEVDYKPNMNIISALQAVAMEPKTAENRDTTPVAYEAACLEEVCGSCTARINGHVAQMCSQLVDDYLGEDNTIALEPMSKFPVVRDLVVDRQRLFEDLKDIEAWVPTDGTASLGPGPKETPANQDVRYALSRCMSCGCCLEVCPQYTPDNDFVGAAVISQVEYFNRHETGKRLKDDRLERMKAPGGVTDCGNAQNCVRVCPKEIPLTESIAKVGRDTWIYGVRKFFTK